jgi:bacteriocin-like protein
MSKTLFKVKKQTNDSKVKVEKLNSKELNNIVGGTINYNSSKSNTGNITDAPPVDPSIHP